MFEPAKTSSKPLLFKGAIAIIRWFDNWLTVGVVINPITAAQCLVNIKYKVVYMDAV